uniref:Uncharacterized protein n=1 Tax=Cannabis sativa TaxID=3483 RepID=A0A803Q8R9_CANSA
MIQNIKNGMAKISTSNGPIFLVEEGVNAIRPRGLITRQLKKNTLTFRESERTGKEAELVAIDAFRDTPKNRVNGLKISTIKGKKSRIKLDKVISDISEIVNNRIIIESDTIDDFVSFPSGGLIMKVLSVFIPGLEPINP